MDRELFVKPRDLVRFFNTEESGPKAELLSINHTIYYINKLYKSDLIVYRYVDI